MSFGMIQFLVKRTPCCRLLINKQCTVTRQGYLGYTVDFSRSCQDELLIAEWLHGSYLRDPSLNTKLQTLLSDVRN